MRYRGVVTFGMIAITITMVFVQSVSAYRFSSTDYVIDASVANNFGGSDSSSSYQLIGSGGESIIGNGASGSYILAAGYVAQLPNSLQLSVQPSNLMGYYALDEPSGLLAVDQSANVLNGSVVGAPSVVAGKIGNARNFNGSSQYVSLGTTSSFVGTTFTIEAWIKSSTATGMMAVVTKDNNFWLGVNGGKAALYDWNAGSACTESTVTVTDGTWHHIVATLNSGVSNGSHIYVDGVSQQNCTWTAVSQGGQPGLGADDAGGSWTQYFNGSIDQAKIFGRVLSADEVKAEYTAQNAGYASGLSLQSITPGTSNNVAFDAIVSTNAPGYTLAINQDHDLQNGSYTIPALSGGTIASPIAWTEGSTKGLGFTLTNTNATAIPAKWSSGNAYAALPGTSTTFYSRSGQQSSKDVLSVRLRADTAVSQPDGAYSNTMTVTGTYSP